MKQNAIISNKHGIYGPEYINCTAQGGCKSKKEYKTGEIIKVFKVQSFTV